MAEAAGLTYVYSNMQEGTLVLAKLTGFTSWPAVICNDPMEGKFFETNEFGNPTKYHVEFLGASFLNTQDFENSDKKRKISSKFSWSIIIII